MTPPEPEPAPGEGLLHPVVVASLAVLLFNDHYWKGVGPPVVTGLLSDFAVLILGPAVLQAGAELLEQRIVGRWRPRRPVLIGAAAVMAAIMVLINVWDPAAWAYRWGLGLLQWPWRALLAGAWVSWRPVHLTMDALDLVTVPAAAVPVLLGWRRTAAL